MKTTPGRTALLVLFGSLAGLVVAVGVWRLLPVSQVPPPSALAKIQLPNPKFGEASGVGSQVEDDDKALKRLIEDNEKAAKKSLEGSPNYNQFDGLKYAPVKGDGSHEPDLRLEEKDRGEALKSPRLKYQSDGAGDMLLLPPLTRNRPGKADIGTIVKEFGSGKFILRHVAPLLIFGPFGLW